MLMQAASCVLCQIVSLLEFSYDITTSKKVSREPVKKRSFAMDEANVDAGDS